jgi:hypothetical protein
MFQIEEKLEKLLNDATPRDLIIRMFQRNRQEYFEAEVDSESSTDMNAAEPDSS